MLRKCELQVAYQEKSRYYQSQWVFVARCCKQVNALVGPPRGVLTHAYAHCYLQDRLSLSDSILRISISSYTAITPPALKQVVS